MFVFMYINLCMSSRTSYYMFIYLPEAKRDTFNSAGTRLGTETTHAKCSTL